MPYIAALPIAQPFVQLKRYSLGGVDPYSSTPLVLRISSAIVDSLGRIINIYSIYRLDYSRSNSKSSASIQKQKDLAYAFSSIVGPILVQALLLYRIGIRRPRGVYASSNYYYNYRLYRLTILGISRALIYPISDKTSNKLLKVVDRGSDTLQSRGSLLQRHYTLCLRGC